MSGNDMLQALRLILCLGFTLLAGAFACLQIFSESRGPRWEPADTIAAIVFALLAIAWRPK